jgi:hypothetical protein
MTLDENLQVLLDDMGTGDSAIRAVDGSLASTGETELRLDTLDTVGRVDVLDEGELPAGSPTLARGDSGGGKEVFPDLEICQQIYIKKESCIESRKPS